MAHQNPRQLALKTLQRVQHGTFADVALDQVLRSSQLDQRDRRLVTELVYGSVRQQRTLDALINQFSQKPDLQHPINLQLILRLGFYQLRYLSHIPPSAAVNTTVELAKANGLGGFKGFVNGVLRQYLRIRDQHVGTAPSSSPVDPLKLPSDGAERLGILYSYPDWIIEAWLGRLGGEDVTQLCQWFNQPPTIDLRINQQQTSIEVVAAAFQAADLPCTQVNGLPHALRLLERPGQIQSLPGFQDGWWTIQDASAQLVGYLLDPQPGETVVDACAAPGGKATHIAELMGDKGVILACDRNPARLRKVTENSGRLRLTAIVTQVRDCSVDNGVMDDGRSDGSCGPSVQVEGADRVLVDAPCSGLGTLHRHADARWRQTAAGISKLAQLQSQILTQAAGWVKPGGTLVYSTCTLLPEENEAVVKGFLSQNPQWSLNPPISEPLFSPYLCPEGWLTVWPHQHNMDGFFMARLKRD